MALIELRDIYKVYDMGAEKVHALNGVDLQVERGEYVAIMGSSGSGKSTLMNLVGCLDTPTSGSYILNGTAVQELDDTQLAGIRNKEIGFVFQTFNLLAAHRRPAQRRAAADLRRPLARRAAGAGEEGAREGGARRAA